MMAIPVGMLGGRLWWQGAIGRWLDRLADAWCHYLNPGLPANRKAQEEQMREYQAIIDRFLP